ncbi:MAG: hypothetical protein RI549_08590, partial [Wenzhouxiangella sp.]|nr:hypothetical protein [Wenzhouxiangella sp.]
MKMVGPAGLEPATYRLEIGKNESLGGFLGRPRTETWPVFCSNRVNLGGSWNNNAQNLRSAKRNRN